MNITADITPPELTFLNIPSRLDLASGVAGLTISAQASDNMSGVKNVQVWFDRNITYSYAWGDGSTYSSNLFLNQGLADSWLDGASSYTWGIAATNLSGTYNVTKVVVEDLQGNYQSYSPGELAKMGVNTSVSLENSTPDVTPPQLLSLAIPAVVDLSSGESGLTIAAAVSDDMSGVKSVQVWFDKNLTYSYMNGDGTKYASNLLLNQGLDDSWLDGYSSYTWGIAATNSSGAYNISTVAVEDKQGNHRYYSASDLEKMGVNTSVILKGATPDVTPPQLTSLAVPDVVDLSSNSPSLTIAGMVSDDMAGVKNIQIWFETNLTYSYVSGDGSQYSSNLLLNQGIYDSWGDGYSSCTWNISGTNKTGIYNIARVIVEDLQGNSRVYSPVELAGMGVGTIIWMVASKTVLTSAGDGFTGTQYADWISGREGNDNLHGLNGDDYIDGGSGDDILDGGTGSDTMIGGSGNDTYYIDSGKDVIIESANGGVDTVISIVSRTLGSYQENLILAGAAVLNATGNSLSNTLVGNSADNVLNGGAGADTMIGGSGNDTYHIDSGRDVVVEVAGGGVDTLISSVSRTLGDYQESLILSGIMELNGTGNGLDNTLTGNSAANVLNGGGGADTMIGGLGSDTYYVDSGRDVVIEGASGGVDTLVSSVSRTLGNYQENLILSGSSPLNGTGNSLDNILTGNSAANVLNGGGGADEMIGGLGNDTYYIDSGRDIVIESANGGIDTLISSVSRTLGNYQENLILSGAAELNGTGNSLENMLSGNSADNVLNGGEGNDILLGGGGSDRLIGGAGKDVLTGGGGSDIFDFNTLNETGLIRSTWDIITDFERGVDKIDLATLDANTETSVNDTFHIIINGGNKFNSAGQLKFDNGVLYGNTDSDSEPEFAIQISGVAKMELSDFAL